MHLDVTLTRRNRIIYDVKLLFYVQICIIWHSMKNHHVLLISARYPDNAPHDQRSSPQITCGRMA